MNKQEAIEKIKSKKISNKFITNYGVGYNKALDDASYIINQIDELKPVVPQYVADMIVKRKEQGCSLVTTLVTLGAFEDARKWIRSGDNGDTFAKAWLYGYEVEKEKLYTVEIPNPNGDGYGRVYLGKNEDNKIELRIWNSFSSIEFSNDWKQFNNAQLTEDEIKNDYNWAWQFAKEVKE